MKNKFKPVIMLTNQKTFPFKLMSFICMLIFGLSSFGQTEYLDIPKPSFNPDSVIKISSSFDVEDEKGNSYVRNSLDNSKVVALKDDFTIWIKSLKYDETEVEEVEISYAKPGDFVKPNTIKIDEKFPSNTYFVIPEKTEVVLTSKHGQETILIAGSKSSSVITENSQNHCSWWGRVKHRILNPLISYNTCAKSKRRTASARGTVFVVGVNGEDVLFERESGKIAIDLRSQVNLNEDLTIDSDEKREIFVTNRIFLNSKITQKSYSTDSITNLDSSDEIDNFFKQQLITNKRILRKSGRNSKSGFKFLNQGEIDKGLDRYKKAILRGEIDRNMFIQSALLLTEAYHITGELKNKSAWLDAALEFIKIEHEINEIQYRHFDSIGATEAASGFKSDYAVATEYYAWAYTVKLKLTGCLENADQNPLKWRLKAKEIKNE